MGSKNASTVLSIGLTTKPEKLQFGPDNRLENYNYWACLDINDPLKWSKKQSMILINEKGNYTAPFKTCTMVALTLIYLRSPSPSANALTNFTYSTATGYPGSSATSLSLNLVALNPFENSILAMVLAVILAFLL